ncbi:hypothetical protein [Metabacillus sp. SLBN-84]
MIILCLTLAVLAINHLIMRNTNKRLVQLSSLILLPVVPAAAYVWMTLIEDDMISWFQLYQSGSFLHFLLFLPIVMGLVVWFCIVYSAVLAILLLDFLAVRKTRKKKERNSQGER